MYPIFGMPTLLELPDLGTNASLCRKLGFSFVEINMNLPQFLPGNLDVNEVLRLKEQYGVFFTLHLPEKLDFCDLVPAVADAWMDTALGALSLAKAIGAPTITMHLSDGIYFTLPGRKEYLYETYMDHYLDRTLLFREKSQEILGDSNLTICIENTGGFHPFQEKGTELLLENSWFGLTLDIGHAHAGGYPDQKFFSKCADRLAHMHLHDAMGKANHLELGTGELDILSLVHFAGDHGIRCVIEVKTEDSLARSAEYIKQYAKDRSEVTT